MRDEAPFTRGSDAELAHVIQLANLFMEAIRSTIDDPRDQAAIGMTAAAMVAGSLYGTMVAVGIESGSSTRTKRALKMVETNFRSGLKVSLSRAAKIAAAEGLN